MTVTNDPTGRVSTCKACGKEIEEALLMKGLRVRVPPAKPGGPERYSLTPGSLVWRTLDRGHGSAVCPDLKSGAHQPTRVRRVSARSTKE